MTQKQLNELAQAKKKATGRKRLGKQAASPKKEQAKGEESTPTDTGEGYVPPVTPSRKLLFPHCWCLLVPLTNFTKARFSQVS